MSETSRRTKIPAFISNRERAQIYEVLAAYAQAGVGFEQALTNLEEAYRDRKSEKADQIQAIIERDGAHNIAGALLDVFTVTPEEAALLRGISAGLNREQLQSVAAVLLSQAARIAAAS